MTIWQSLLFGIKNAYVVAEINNYKIINNSKII